MFVVVDEVVAALLDRTVVDAGVLARDGRVGEAERIGKRLRVEVFVFGAGGDADAGDFGAGDLGFLRRRSRGGFFGGGRGRRGRLGEGSGRRGLGGSVTADGMAEMRSDATAAKNERRIFRGSDSR